MPLLDHFRPPLFPLRHWESFHAYWASEIGANLNTRLLPAGYFAEAHTHVGGRFEVDIGTCESTDVPLFNPTFPGAVALAEAPAMVAPPPIATLPIVYPDCIEVRILSEEGGLDIVAAIELVSPGNKDRDENRDAFVAKCATYLHEGVGLIVVDIVTVRLANLHDRLAEFLGTACPMPTGTSLYATAYRPVRRERDKHLDVWAESLAIGKSLPWLPLALRRGPTLMLDLDATYRETCRRSRLTLPM